ncbi:MAG: hypothetical protein B9S38_00865 [Verrucomicrobiia bacterium Tous-C4TDCM]|nr:MAG: hypothetical protein B9S38_00865 [Verrucomicrobiae bacterium Tous-C4TDCM]
MGFEVHVIGGGRAVPADSGGRSLEMGLRIGSGETKQRSAASPGQPVHRLGAADEEPPLQVKPMSEAGPAEPRISSREQRARRGLARWTGWMAVATCLAVVAAVAGLMRAGKGKVSNAASNPGYVFEKQQHLDREQEYFLVHSGELIKQAEKLLERYAAATSLEQVLPLVRDAEQVKERMARLWKPWGTDPMLAAGGEITCFVLEESARAGISLKGYKGDFSPFDMVFIREGEGLTLDWEASQGIGEVQIAELLEGAAAEDRVVRGIIQPAEFYSQAFPESRFRSFRLVDAGGDLFVWVFAPLDSAVASVLKTEFNEGSLLLEKSVQIPASVRLSGTGGSSGKCYEITEMLHKGWVRP